MGHNSSPIERFLEKFTVTANGCWEWNAKIDRDGYGRFTMKGTSDMAHRVSYELHIGTIGPFLDVDHLCRNRKCVNPAHLEAVTRRENNLRSECISTKNRQKTHCKRGHEFDAQNTYLYNNARICRRCKADRLAATSEKERAQ